MEISDFYLDPGLKTFGGRYYQEDNVYVPNEKAAGAELLYAGVHFNKCYEVFEIQVEGGISEIAGGLKSSIAEQRSSEIASKDDLKVQVYPNPSAGLVFLQLPKNIEGQVLLRLYDINGRQIWEQQQAANVLQSIDLSQTIADGIYALQIWQKEQLLDQQKIVLTR